MSTKPEELPNRREALKLGAGLGATLAGGGALAVAVDAAAGGARNQVTLRMTEKQAKTFARKIQNDDAFRERLERSPRRVFAQNGVHFPRGFLPERVTLPSKAELRETFEATRRIVGGAPDTQPGLFCLILAWAIFVLAAIIIESQ